MNTFYRAVFLSLTACVFFTNSYSQSNGRENWFPNRGHVGIGTRSPSTELDVIGNVNVTNRLSVQDIKSNNVESTSLTILNNAIINGSVGIGISPTEKLHVVGNFKLDGNLFARELQIQSLLSGTATFNNLTVNQSSSFIGVTTFGEKATFSRGATFSEDVGIGTLTPSEKLHVAGNLKVDNSIFSDAITTTGLQTGQFTALGVATFSENASFSKDAAFSGKVGIGISTPSEKLHVAGNLKVDNSISASGLTTAEFQTGQFTASGLSSFAEKSVFAKDVIVSGKLGLGVASPTEVFEVSGNGKFSGSIHSGTVTAGTGSFSNGLQSGNTTVTGDLQVSGKLNANQLALATINTTGNASVGNNLVVTGASELKGGVNMIGNSTVEGNFQVSGTLTSRTIVIDEIKTNGNTTFKQNVIVNGSAEVGGDLNVAGKFKGGIIEASEFKLVNGGSPFNLDNLEISQTLAIGTDKAVPADYKLAVGGNIIATGIDIKIPQKWPDYVFTDGHKILTITEVKEFIEKNGHLPGILSAKEMEKQETYGVAEMDGKLLEKIEELTLYIIQLEQRLKALEK